MFGSYVGQWLGAHTAMQKNTVWRSTNETISLCRRLRKQTTTDSTGTSVARSTFRMLRAKFYLHICFYSTPPIEVKMEISIFLPVETGRNIEILNRLHGWRWTLFGTEKYGDRTHGWRWPKSLKAFKVFTHALNCRARYQTPSVEIAFRLAFLCPSCRTQLDLQDSTSKDWNFL